MHVFASPDSLFTMGRSSTTPGPPWSKAADARKGKKTLRTHSVAFKPAPSLKPRDLVSLRKKLDVSRPIFASYLRTNARTIENWEQGRARPNAQAALLIKLVTAYPDTVERLAAL